MSAENKLIVSTNVNPADWNKGVDMLNGLCFHLYEWSLYSSERYRTNSIYFQLYDESGLLLSLSSGQLTTNSFAGILNNKVLSFSCLPVNRNNDALKSMVKAIIDYCKKNNIVSLNIGSFGTPFGSEVLVESGFSVKKRWEFLLNIDMCEEDLWKNLRSTKRNKVKKAKKAKLRIEKGKTLDHVMQFRGLALETQKRKKEMGIPFPVAGEDSYAHLKTKLMDSGLGKLYIAYDRGFPVAGAFFARYNRSAYYMLSSANEQGLKKAAPDLILWNSISDFHKEGCNVFNFGGVSESELEGQPLEKSGLYQYKKAFSTQVHLCHKGTLCLRPVTNKTYEFAKKVRYILFKHN